MMFQLSREYLEGGLKRIYIVAYGSAHYVGCLGKYILERICPDSCGAHSGFEFRYADRCCADGTLVVIIQPVRRDGGYPGCPAGGQTAGRPDVGHCECGGRAPLPRLPIR